MDVDIAALNRKIGPLPVWAWTGIGTVTLIIIFRIRANRAATAAVTPSSDPNADDPSLSGDYGGSTDGTLTNVGTNGGVAPSTRATNNQEWQVQATDILVGMGHDPLEVQRALGDYLAGITLDFNEQRLVRIAVNTIGSPPEPVPVANGPVAPPTTTPTTGTATTRLETHRISVATSIHDLAVRFADDPTNPDSVEAMVRRIYDANPTLRGKTTAPAGFAVKVPVTVKTATPVNTASVSTSAKTYTVQSGESLESIASKFNTSRDRLYDANVAIVGDDPRQLRAGTVLVIP